MLLGFVHVDDHEPDDFDDHEDQSHHGVNLWNVFLFMILITLVCSVLLLATSEPEPEPIFPRNHAIMAPLGQLTIIE